MKTNNHVLRLFTLEEQLDYSMIDNSLLEDQLNDLLDDKQCDFDGLLEDVDHLEKVLCSAEDNIDAVLELIDGGKENKLSVTYKNEKLKKIKYDLEQTSRDISYQTYK